MNKGTKFGIVIVLWLMLIVASGQNSTNNVQNTTTRYRSGSVITFDTSVNIADEDGTWSTNAWQFFKNGSGGGGQSQTPWTSNINGAGNSLSNVNIITATNIILSGSGTNVIGPSIFNWNTNGTLVVGADGVTTNAPFAAANFGTSTTNTLTLHNGTTAITMTNNVAITNLIAQFQGVCWERVVITNSTASTFSFFFTYPGARASGPVSFTANTNGLQVASGKMAFGAILLSGATNWADSVEP